LSSSEPQAVARVGLLTQDLLVRSRVQVGLGRHAAGLELIAGEEITGTFDLLLVDLNRNPEEQLARLGRLVRAQPDAEVICFGPHTHMAQLSPTAKAAGATRCVANSHLPETLQRWLRAWEEASTRPRRAPA